MQGCRGLCSLCQPLPTVWRPVPPSKGFYLWQCEGLHGQICNASWSLSEKTVGLSKGSRLYRIQGKCATPFHTALKPCCQFEMCSYSTRVFVPWTIVSWLNASQPLMSLNSCVRHFFLRPGHPTIPGQPPWCYLSSASYPGTNPSPTLAFSKSTSKINSDILGHKWPGCKKEWVQMSKCIWQGYSCPRCNGPTTFSYILLYGPQHTFLYSIQKPQFARQWLQSRSVFSGNVADWLGSTDFRYTAHGY